MADKTSLIKIVVDVEEGILQINELKLALNDTKGATQGLNDELNKQKKVVEGSAAAIKKQIRDLVQLRNTQAATNKEYRKATLEIKALEQQLAQLSHTAEDFSNVNLKSGKALDTLNKNLGSTASGAGLAGAATQELGRLISDAPYGIQGMANNLSQLGSMFGQLVGKTKSFSGAISLMTKTLNSPIGLLVAFQAVVAAIEFFSTMQQKAKRETESLTKEIEDQTKALREQQEIFNELAEVTLTDEAIDVLGSQIKEVGAYLEAAKQTNEVLTGDILAFAIEQGKRIVSARIEQAKLRAEILAISEEAEQMRKDGREDTDEFKEKLQAQRVLSNQFKDAILEEKDALSLLDLQKQEDLVLTNEQTKATKSSTDALKDKLKALDEEIRYLNKIIGMRQSDLETETDVAMRRLLLKQEQTLGDVEFLEWKQEYFTNLSNLEGISSEDSIKYAEKSYQAFKQTETLKEQLKKKALENDKKVLEAETKIQDTKSKNAVAAFKLLGSISREGSKLQALALIGESAAGIAKIVSNTKAANAAIDLKYALIPGGMALAKAQKTANNIGAGIGIAANVAATQKALAALKSSQTAKTETVRDESAGEVQEPDFNVVGASQLNQVAELVAGQQESPIRTYVVASDVSTAQELDRNILSEASIG